MARWISFIGGIGLGASLMYFADPDKGRRRRALVRDQLVHGFNLTDEAIDTTGRDLSHRAQGLMAEISSLGSSERVADDVLVERVRAHMGRVVSHPGAIDVSASQGRVTLSGPILAGEVDDLLRMVASLPGVTGVESQLDVHEQAGDISSLQGQGSRPGIRFELLQTNWSPTARLLVGIAGGVLTLSALGRRGLVAMAVGTLGLGMLARAITNMPFSRLVGIGRGRRAVDIHKTITIDAPIDRVYEFWTNLENLPRFMSHLREVGDLGEGRSHWTALGPAGILFEWDAVITRRVPNQVLAWKSVPGSIVPNAGITHFESTPNGGTRLDIQMTYNPPAGALGHMLASLLGSDPKHAMDEDLIRFKSLMEVGKTTAHGREVTRNEILEARKKAA